MLEYLSYILFFTTLIVILIYLYIRLKFGFWALQPVFHLYDIGYIIKPGGIIQNYLPEKNKYTNFTNIETILFPEMSSLKIQRFVNLIKTNYLQNKENIYNPRTENIVPYFVGHNDKTFVSFYSEDSHMVSLKKGTTITDSKIIGVMTTRPIHITINNGNKDAKFDAYYVDYLCVDKLYRKKGIAPQLIQTHHYNQRHSNKNIVVSLFNVTTWTKPPDLSAEYKLLEINAHNFHFLVDFIKDKESTFDIVICVEIANILELIKTKNMFIYTILSNEQIICVYFFRKTCIEVQKGLEVLTCFASISNCDDNIFIKGYKISFWKIAAENYFGFAAIENISHNNIIIDNIVLKTKPLVVSPSAYFFYNFAYSTFKSNKVLIIN
jgi:GNAT superfamily N-acetyltransferase